MKPKIGRQYRFTPCVWLKNEETKKPVNGSIDYINWKNRFFRVAYQSGGTIQHECFKFEYQ